MEICKICQKEFEKSSSLSGHIVSIHRITVKQYIIQTQYNGVIPRCKLCDNEPSFLQGKNIFKQYCKEHANEGRRDWSKNNKTFDYGWKKGLTKNDHEGIMKQSEAISGNKNPWFGKRLPDYVLRAAAKARTEKLTLTNIEFEKRANNVWNNKYDYSECLYIHSKEKTLIRCKIHNHSFWQRPNDHLSGYEGCEKCSPVPTLTPSDEVIPAPDDPV